MFGMDASSSGSDDDDLDELNNQLLAACDELRGGFVHAAEVVSNLTEQLTQRDEEILDLGERCVQTEQALREREEELERQYRLLLVAEARLAEGGLPPVCSRGHLAVRCWCPKCLEEFDWPRAESREGE